MKVRNVMTPAPASCSPDTDLGTAVRLLWSCNCGALPVVDRQRKVVSMITDRDICVALGTRSRLPGEIKVGEVVSQRAVCCLADDDLRSAIDKMADAGVRRLAVVNPDRILEGILSTDDIVEGIPSKGAIRGSGTTAEEVLNALKMICAQQVPKKDGVITQAA